LFFNWNYAPWDQSVVPEDQRLDETNTNAAEIADKSERGSFKEILKQIDEYIQSLLDGSKDSQEDEALQETSA